MNLELTFLHLADINQAVLQCLGGDLVRFEQDVKIINILLIFTGFFGIFQSLFIFKLIFKIFNNFHILHSFFVNFIIFAYWDFTFLLTGIFYIFLPGIQYIFYWYFH